MRERPDLEDLQHHDRLAELKGEAELERIAGAMVRRGPVAAIAGWCPGRDLAEVAGRVAVAGGAVVRIQPRAGAAAPTSVPAGAWTRQFQPLVDTYGTVPYRDLNPAVMAGLSYVVMFGMMFGDVGHGLMLMAGGLLIRGGRPAALVRLRRFAPFVIAGGASSTLFGLAYGEAFGPTGLVPVLWMRPLDHVTSLLLVAVAVGGALLAASYALGTVNRWRESGGVVALTDVTGLAGGAIYIGLALGGAGIYFGLSGLMVAGAALLSAGLVLAFTGSLLRTRSGAGRGFQAFVETFDATVRVGSNTMSFTRLAAFGLTHAALGQVIWSGTVALAGAGPAGWAPSVLLFTAGNAAAFALEGLVAGVQALRLEYYELFSRLFTTEGRPFRPWCIPVGDAPGRAGTVTNVTGHRTGSENISPKETSCLLG